MDVPTITFKAVVEFIMSGFAYRSGFHVKARLPFIPDLVEGGNHFFMSKHVKARLPFIPDLVEGGNHFFTVPGVEEVAISYPGYNLGMDFIL